MTISVTCDRPGYIPQAERKNILLMCDDVRAPSGVGTMGRQIIIETCHRYNWVNVAAAMSHPEVGKVLDACPSLAETSGVPDAFLHLYPSTGYGNPGLVRTLIAREKIDAIMIFTDPRYWVWLFSMEHELRQQLPIIYYSIWDDLPFPMYNKPFYRSVDALFGISKQSHCIHKVVLGEENFVLYPFTPVPVSDEVAVV